MKYVSMYTGSDQKSHFKDVEVSGSAENSDPMPVTTGKFRVSTGSPTDEWHPAPRKQFIVILSGYFEFDVEDDSRRFGAGSIVLAGDVTGKGHVTRVQPGTEFLILPFAE